MPLSKQATPNPIVILLSGLFIVVMLLQFLLDRLINVEWLSAISLWMRQWIIKMVSDVPRLSNNY